jgi:nicotinamidase-related amidase
MLNFFKRLFRLKSAVSNNLEDTPLYIVDMQPGFSASNSIIEETLKEIELAKKNNDWIIFVELTPKSSKPTHKKLTRFARKNGYQKVKVITKPNSDGSEEFIGAAKGLNLNYKKVKVCGVNRHACVLATVKGLDEKLPEAMKIEVAWAATAPGGVDEPKYSSTSQRVVYS